MKSLNRIQILIKVVYVISIVVFACLIAGAVFSALATGIYHLVQGIIIDKGGKTIAMALLERGITTNMVYTYLATGIFSCLVLAFIYIYFARLFRSVIEDKTPFLRSTVKRMRKVALVAIVINLVASILVGIAFVIARAVDRSAGVFQNYSVFSIAFELFILVLSLFIEYPVEKEELEHKEKEEALKPEDYIE